MLEEDDLASHAGVSVEGSSCFVGRDEKRAPLKTPAWEAKDDQVGRKNRISGVKEKQRAWFMTQRSHESKFELLTENRI